MKKRSGHLKRNNKLEVWAQKWKIKEFESRLSTPWRFRSLSRQLWRHGDGPQRMFMNEWCKNDLLYKRKINAKRVSYGHQTFKKKVWHNSGRKEIKRDTSFWTQTIIPVADPGCLSQMPVPDTNFSIPYLGSRVKMMTDPRSGSGSELRI